MPGPVTHYSIATDVCGQLQDSGVSELSFSPEHRRAFLAGALVVDSGYFGSADPFASNLAHYIRSGALVRIMVQEAKSDQEHAFAFGWLSHHVADVKLHPLVNRGVARSLADQSGSVAYHVDPKEHLRVELGLDAFSASLQRDIRTLIVPEPLLSAVPTSFLVHVYSKTYDVRIEESTFEHSHAMFELYCEKLMRFAYILAAEWFGSDAKRQFPYDYYRYLLPGRLLSRIFGKSYEYYGIGACLRPSEDDQRQWKEGVQKTVAEVVRVITHQDLTLEDAILDTGEVESSERPYPLAEKARAALAKHQAQSSAKQ